MAIWRRCTKRTCANPKRCLEHLYFDVTHRGARYRVPANEFAIPRMDPNKHLRKIDLRWHDLRHEGASRLLADGVDIRIIQLMLGHASIMQTQRYLNITDEELRRGLEVSWKNESRPLRVVSRS